MTGKKTGAKIGSTKLEVARRHQSEPPVTSPESSAIAEDVIEVSSAIASAKSSEIIEESGALVSSFGDSGKINRNEIISEESAIRDDFDKGNLDE